MAKRINFVLVAVIVLFILMSLVSCESSDGSEPMQTKYVLYIGIPETADGDLDFVKEVINGICLKYIDGYTVIEGEGGWTDNGKLVKEETLIYSFCFTERSKVEDIANEVLKTVEGSNVLFEIQHSYAVHSSSDEFPKK